MKQVTSGLQTLSEMKFLKTMNRMNTGVLQVFTTQSNFIFGKYKVQELIGASI